MGVQKGETVEAKASAVSAYAWPDQPRIIAPEPDPNRLVTWSQFKGYGGIGHGLIAWIGEIRIGRIDLPRLVTDQCEWFFALPYDPEDYEETPQAATGHGTEAQCRRLLEMAAQVWMEKAGLMRVVSA